MIEPGIDDIVDEYAFRSNGGGGRPSDAVGEPVFCLIKDPKDDGENTPLEGNSGFRPCPQGCGVVPLPLEKLGVIPVAGGGQPKAVGVNGGRPCVAGGLVVFKLEEIGLRLSPGI